MYDAVFQLLELQVTICAVVDESEPMELRLKCLVTTHIDALTILSVQLDTLRHAVKEAETGSVSHTLGRMMMVQRMLNDSGTSYSKATGLLQVAFNGLRPFSGTVGHRASWQAGYEKRLRSYYGVVPSSGPASRGT